MASCRRAWPSAVAPARDWDSLLAAGIGAGVLYAYEAGQDTWNVVRSVSSSPYMLLPLRNHGGRNCDIWGWGLRGGKVANRGQPLPTYLQSRSAARSAAAAAAASTQTAHAGGSPGTVASHGLGRRTACLVPSAVIEELLLLLLNSSPYTTCLVPAIHHRCERA